MRRHTATRAGSLLGYTDDEGASKMPERKPDKSAYSFKENHVPPPEKRAHAGAGIVRAC